MTNKIMIVNFRGAELYGFNLGGSVYVALKPIVEAMGLDWSAQYRRVQRDPILSEGVAMVAIPFQRGGPQNGLALRLELVHVWLFTINSLLIKRGEVRERVQLFQRECYSVLHRYFAAENVEEIQHAMEAESLHLRMVTEARQTHGNRAAAELWQKLGLPMVPAMADAIAQLELFSHAERAA